MWQNWKCDIYPESLIFESAVWQTIIMWSIWDCDKIIENVTFFVSKCHKSEKCDITIKYDIPWMWLYESVTLLKKEPSFKIQTSMEM